VALMSEAMVREMSAAVWGEEFGGMDQIGGMRERAIVASLGPE